MLPTVLEHRMPEPPIRLQPGSNAALFFMLELEEAVARVLALLPPPRSERIPLGEAHGRVLAQRLLSPLDLPSFDNSAMDGYALRAADVHTATPNSAIQLRLAGRVAAGEVLPKELASGECVRLFTGSALPLGADAVVMQEDTRLDPNTPGEVFILEAPHLGENVRLRGEDVTRGATLANKGDILTAGRLSLVAAAGIAEVDVGRRPTVSLIATGSELKEPGHPLLPGQIHESNRVGLAALIRRAGGLPRIFPLVSDSLEETRQVLAEALEQSDLLVTSGGASVGDMDFIKPAFGQLGVELAFWKVAIKPGRPFLLGRRQDKLIFGLPGNPVSALITFLLLVRPALLRSQGATNLELPSSRGVLAEPLANPGARRHFLRVTLDPSGAVSSAGTQASHALSSFAVANGLVDAPPGMTMPKGATVVVKTWD